jgi:hypothetical protein
MLTPVPASVLRRARCLYTLVGEDILPHYTLQQPSVAAPKFGIMPHLSCSEQPDEDDCGVDSGYAI